MATGYISSTLADFTSANPQKALSLVILDGKGTKDWFSIETGVKYLTKVPKVTAVTVDISTGAIAGYNTGSGGTTFNDVTLQNTQLKIFETYRKEDLTKTIMGALQKKGTNPEEMVAEDLILGLKATALSLANENLIWQDAAVKIATTGGVLKQLADASTYNLSGIAAYSFQTASDASAIAAVNACVTKMETEMPEYIMQPMILAMSPANFAKYGKALYALNGAVSTQTIGVDGKPIESLYVPGTNVQAVAMKGLSGSNHLVLTSPDNIIQVVDLVSEDEFLSFIYNPFARWFELAGQYKLGVKVVDPTKVVRSN